ncbi:TraR/DksA family transcriptional regulator [Antricoccus suffuscus]|uniref:TraR/DksA family transcriptional regulator n=1 Tax=Antricoccus suffuscus TaxID=1629062 RepID=A0A2T1A5W2_9ACTN|nr:TraR/DksA C4-type zinc finger protein [Antricoccus suffuscus]PRZ43979.1 TraR/DksA family transcriptional regulator [Antricoccus suffuscus]
MSNGDPTYDESRIADRLDEQRAATEQRIAEMRAGFDGMVAASEGSNADDEHDPEGATIAFERSQLGALIDQAELQLREIAHAAQKISDGKYGVCESCGAQIAPARLDARPIARTCINCATKR